MLRTKCASRSLAMHIELSLAAVDHVGFHFAGIVRDIIQQFQLGIGQHPLHAFPGQVSKDLTIGEGAVDAGPHGAKISLSDVGFNWSTGQFTIR